MTDIKFIEVGEKFNFLFLFYGKQAIREINVIREGLNKNPAECMDKL